MLPGIARMMPARSTSIHIWASVCRSSIGSSSIPQRAAEVPIGPANATERGASTAVTSWLRLRLDQRIPFARWSTCEPGWRGAPPRTRHSRTVGAHSGQRPTSETYAHTSGTLLAIVMRLSVLIRCDKTCLPGFRLKAQYGREPRSDLSERLVGAAVSARSGASETEAVAHPAVDG